MFDIGYSELLVVAIVALVVIGPKDLPRVMRTVGEWVGRARGMARHFRSGIDTMIRESELEEMEKKWREENERIMREHPLTASWDDPAALPAPGETAAHPDESAMLTDQSQVSPGQAEGSPDQAGTRPDPDQAQLSLLPPADEPGAGSGDTRGRPLP